MELAPLKPGKTVEGAEITAYKSEIKSPNYIHVLAGVHGDEIEGVYLASELIKVIEEDNEIDLPLVIIPILNVDGYRSGTRLNAHGVDLNRNLPTEDWLPKFSNKLFNPGPGPLSEQENNYFVDLLEKYPPYLIISIHSGKPHLSHTDGCEGVAHFMAKHNQYPIINEEKRNFPGSLENYAQTILKCPVFTIIAPKIKNDKSLKDIWNDNQEGLIELFKNGLIDPDNNLVGL